MSLSSFKHAFHGILGGVKEEKNFKVMLLCFVLVLLANIVFKVTTLEWIITLICSGIVLAAELINSAVEKTIDFITDEFHNLAGAAKDYSAGASLIVSAVSFIIALIIYLPYFIDFVRRLT